MKAIVFKEYGKPEHVMQIAAIQKPVPAENEVLVKVHSTTVNDYDWAVTTGKPLLYRLMFGLFKPKNNVPGMELSGIVESVGSNVQSLKIGDAVMGDISNHGLGSFAEYIALNEKALVSKPDFLSFEEAASLPHASLLALQGLVRIGNIQKEHKILINGAGGGVGAFAVQIAKHYACHVTGVDKASKFKTMKNLGYDECIDYETYDFTKMGIKYDLILDCKSTRSAFAYRRALNKNGMFVTVGGTVGVLLRLLFWGITINPFSRKKTKILAHKPNEGLGLIFDLIKDKKLKPLIDGPYDMGEIPRLVQYFGEGKHEGKIVINIP